MNDNERKAAELAYTSTANDYVRAPIGSRDWAIFLQGFQAALDHRVSAIVKGESGETWQVLRMPVFGKVTVPSQSEGEPHA